MNNSVQNPYFTLVKNSRLSLSKVLARKGGERFIFGNFLKTEISELKSRSLPKLVIRRAPERNNKYKRCLRDDKSLEEYNGQ